MGSVSDIQKSLHDHLNARIQSFSVRYHQYLSEQIQIFPDNAISSMSSLLDAVSRTPYRVYLLIDEYDNFANEIMMNAEDGRSTYEALVYEKGPLKTLFKAVKSESKREAFDRTFITGVSPVVMNDITSGYNIAKNIYLNKDFNHLCGLRESEVESAVTSVVKDCNFEDTEIVSALHQMRTWYNGYVFSERSEEKIYNPTLVIYFLDAFSQECRYPDNMLDSNLAVDQAKLEYISQIPKGAQIIMDISNYGQTLLDSRIIDRFGMAEMLSDASKDNRFLASYLYYFGVLTFGGRTEEGKLNLDIPNLVMQGLYIERIQRMLLPDPALRDDGRDAASLLYTKGDISALCRFIEDHYFKILNNRDYRWANELTVKMAFLTLLHNDSLYMMDSETSLNKGYADLTMIIRPDMRQYKIFDVLVEFKYVSLKNACLDKKQADALTPEELASVPKMVNAMVDAQQQAKTYGDFLESKYKNLRLRRYAVVSLGFERVWGVEVQ
jgi:hypothetical protein